MKYAFNSAGLTSVVLLILTFLSLSAAWPRRHSHRTRNISSDALPTSSADSGSALIFRPVGGNNTNDHLYVYSLKHRAVARTKDLSSSSPSSTTVIQLPLGSQTNQLDRVLIYNPHQRVHFYESANTISTQATLARSLPSIVSSAQPDHTHPAALEAVRYKRAANPDNSGDYGQGGEKTSHRFRHRHTTTVYGTSTTELSLTLTPSSVLSGPSVLVDAVSPSSISSTLNAETSSLCDSDTGSVTYETSGMNSYDIVCNADYPGNDLALIHTDSYESCMESCDAFNKQYSADESCVGISYVPSWINGANNCFLKFIIGDQKNQPWHVDSALLASGPNAPSSAQPSSGSSATAAVPVQSVVAAAMPAPSASPPISSQMSSISSTSALSVSSTSTLVVLSSADASPTMAGGPSISYASGRSVIAPTAGSSNLHGTSSNEPTSQYIKWSNPPNLKLSSNYLTKSINGDLSTQYGLSPDTGVLEVNDTTKPLLSDLKNKPHLSRDGGKGGYLDGHKVFLFCDTGSYTPPSGDLNGNFLGFVSSSAAIDKGMNAASGKALTIQDGIGQWSDDVGRMRGFSPMTSGEQSYNLAMQGNGQRYAIWPESSILPFNQTHALLYAPIIFDDVDMKTKAAKFTYTGTTLLVLSVPGEGGPLALRLVDKLFEQNEVEWGTIGGIRSYGPSGMGGNDGKVYIFGNVQGGLLAARVDAGAITNRGSYEYWNGVSWDKGMQPLSSQAHFIKGAFMDGDIFYSPRHLTFIFVYLNPYADNTFYFRYLQADSAILPPSAPGGDKNSDFAEAMFKYTWSTEQVLYHAPPGSLGKYIYAGGVHQGYFDEDDVTNGGKKMLLSWTLPTGSDPSAQDSEYYHITADIEWN
ncbi:MAG: hypothetical protein M1812_004313 [Candelaria pacifica]|nr:MAG: hypothetical protein M1812_004313 [Candelaria pacifica]